MKRIGWIPALWRYMRDREASIFGKLLALFAVAYVIMPLDLIPDVAPVIGWLDDLGVVALVGAWLTRRIAEYRGPRDLPPAPSRRAFSVIP
jgi:uncharacterized membrane protein YkvA (DUF1232 family)